MRHRAVVGLGSNIAPRRNVRAALACLSELGSLEKISPVYETDPVGPPQPTFLNAAAVVETELTPGELKEGLRKIEDELGRSRDGARYGPRTIDLDVVLFGDLAGEHEGVVLPHPDLERFPHVAIPVADVVPELEIPGSVRRMADVAAAMDRTGMRVVDLDEEG